MGNQSSESRPTELISPQSSGMNCGLGNERFKPSLLGEQTYSPTRSGQGHHAEVTAFHVLACCFFLEGSRSGEGLNGVHAAHSPICSATALGVEGSRRCFPKWLAEAGLWSGSMSAHPLGLWGISLHWTSNLFFCCLLLLFEVFQVQV